MSATAEPAASPPKASSESVLKAPRNPVAQYSPKLIGAGLAVLATVAGVALVFGLSPPSPAPAKNAEPASKSAAGSGDSSPPVAGLPTGYGDPKGPLGQSPPPATLPSAEAVRAGPGPQQGAAAQPAAMPATVAAGRQEAMELARAARSAGPFFPASQATPDGAGPGRSEAPVASPSSTPLSTVGQEGESGPVPLPASAVQNMQGEKRAFIAGARSTDPDYLASPYLRPLSPYEVKAGTLIPAALVTALNSDLPGEIVAQVTQPVFDHATGRHLLIPQGARLLGRYDSQVASGQDRILIVWTRIVMPDGRSINIGAMGGTDIRGEAGLSDRVDTHIGPLTRAVALATAITVGGSIAQNASTRSSGNLVLNDAAGGASSGAAQVGQRFVERDLNRQPTLRVRPGWPVRVLVNRDIILEPY